MESERPNLGVSDYRSEIPDQRNDRGHDEGDEEQHHDSDPQTRQRPARAALFVVPHRERRGGLGRPQGGPLGREERGQRAEPRLPGCRGEGPGAAGPSGTAHADRIGIRADAFGQIRRCQARSVALSRQLSPGIGTAALRLNRRLPEAAGRARDARCRLRGKGLRCPWIRPAAARRRDAPRIRRFPALAAPDAYPTSSTPLSEAPNRVHGPGKGHTAARMTRNCRRFG